MSHKLLLAAFMASFAALAQAQKHVLRSIASHRFEINDRYDQHPDMQAEAVLAPYRPAVDSLQQPVIGESETEMWVGRPECPLANWTADLLLAEARRMGYDAKLAVTNMGGLRASLPAGVIRLSNIFEIAPFDNRLCTLSLRGSDLLELCRQIASVGGEGTSGLKLACSADGRLLEALCGGEPIDTARTYIVATIDYLAEGNDKMTAFKRAVEKQVHQRAVRDIYVEHIRHEAAEGRKLSAKVEGRVTVTGTAGHQAPMEQEHPSLYILHTNDTHSQILPVSPNVTNKNVAGKGGYLRRAAFLRQQREQHPDLLLMDAGDFSQGTLFYNLFKGETEISLMNHMGYDVATIGNHEFDNGLENLANLLRMAKFPFVCANYDFTGTPCEGLVKPYTIIWRGGLKIGVFGLGCALQGMVSESKCPGVKFIPPVEAADKVVDILHDEEHCDLVVCLSHMGWIDEPMSDMDFIPQSHGIDIMIGGHSHTYMTAAQYLTDRNNHLVANQQMGKSGCYIGCLELEF